MRGWGFAYISLIVFTASGCGVGYYVTVECEYCHTTGQEEGFGCSEAEAQAAAEELCRNGNGSPGPQIGSPRTELGPYCRAGNAPAALEPIPETARFFKHSCDTARRVIAVAKAGEVEACPAPKIAFTVVFHNELTGGMYCEGVPRSVRVGYYKYSPIPPFEYAEFEGSVDFGGSDTIVISDAKASTNNPSEAGFIKVEFQVFQVEGTTCSGIPLDDESYSRVITEGIQEGSTLHITLNNQSVVEVSISGSNAAVGMGNLQKVLQPIPDPMFTLGQP